MAVPGCDPCCSIENTAQSQEQTNWATLHLLCQIEANTAGGGGGGSAVNLTQIAGTATSVNNGISDAGTLRVTMASDSTGTVAIGTIVPGTTATSLGKAEDDASASGDTGVAQLLKRVDVAAVQTSAAGDYSVPVVNSFGAQLTNIDSTYQQAVTTGIMKAAGVAGVTSDSMVAVGGRTNLASASRYPTDGHYGIMSLGRNGSVQISSDVGGLSSAEVGVAFFKQEDAVHANGDCGVPAWSKRTDLPAASSGTDGDYQTTNTDDRGALWHTPICNKSGGFTPLRISGGLTNTVTAVKSSALSKLGPCYFYNSNSAVVFVQVFNVATAGAVTLGTTAPTECFPVPPFGGATFGTDIGAEYSAGIQVAATTTETGSTAPTAAITANFRFK